jgi:isopenicillin-N epimerase
LPISNKEQIVNEIFNGYTNKTKALFISHITSTTALILPVKEICDRAKELGLMTIVDGAHVPGHIPLKINDLNADIYTGACHKWMLSPKGASFLYVNKKLQDLFDPLVISWGYESDDPSDSKFIDYHQYQGTRDIAAFLTVPRAIDFLDENNWLEVSLNCKRLVLDNFESLCSVLGSSPICPLNSDFLGQMCSAPIKSKNEIKLKEVLFNKYKIEIPLMKSDDQLFIRMSVQCYNSQKDIDYLFNVLEELNKSSDLIH